MSTLPGMPHLGTYRIVLADPPWSHNNYGQAKHGAAKAIYDEMPIEALEEMPVGELAHPDGALLFLWCTGPQAAEGAHLRLARAWGFELRTRVFAWVKVVGRCAACGHGWDDHAHPAVGGAELPGRCSATLRLRGGNEACWCEGWDVRADFGPGSYTGGNVEDVWLGVRGDTPWSAERARRDVRQVVFSPAPHEHSRKPDEVQARIEALWPDATPRLELFARRRRKNWAAWGAQAPACDLVFGDAIGTTWPVPERAAAPVEPVEEQAALFDGATP